MKYNKRGALKGWVEILLLTELRITIASMMSDGQLLLKRLIHQWLQTRTFYGAAGHTMVLVRTRYRYWTWTCLGLKKCGYEKIGGMTCNV
jgi:hypothetical protein